MTVRAVTLCGCIALGLLGARVASGAQQPTKVPRVGYLSVSSPSPEYSSNLDAFRQGLRELGYVEGQNIAIEYRWAHGNFERLPDLAVELVRLKVEVIVAVVTQASLAAKHATSTIPVVMVAVSDPVGSGLVASLARPSANITGTSAMAAELVGKQLELLKEVVPKVSRMGVLWNPANPVFQAVQLREAKAAAQVLGVRLQILEARGPDEFDRAFSAMTRARASALAVLGDPIFGLHRNRIADLAAKNRLPTVSGTSEYAEAGGLMGYGPSYPLMHRRAATYVDKILRGAKPADLPVEQAMRFELVLNMKTARALGITFPPSIMVRADQVIQ